MKATLTFNLPDEWEEMSECLEGWRWKGAIWELSQWLREQRKYEERHELPTDEIEAQLHNALFDRGLEI